MVRFMNRGEVEDLAALQLGLEMKDTHTIIEKWPLSLKKRQGDPGAKEEFKNLAAFGHLGTDRYIEWTWMAEPEPCL
jgi:hypothetical protein